MVSANREAGLRIELDFGAGRVQECLVSVMHSDPHDKYVACVLPPPLNFPTTELTATAKVWVVVPRRNANKAAESAPSSRSSCDGAHI